jgi:hypothetical protein
MWRVSTMKPPGYMIMSLLNLYTHKYMYMCTNTRHNHAATTQDSRRETFHRVRVRVSGIPACDFMFYMYVSKKKRNMHMHYHKNVHTGHEIGNMTSEHHVLAIKTMSDMVASITMLKL